LLACSLPKRSKPSPSKTLPRPDLDFAIAAPDNGIPIDAPTVQEIKKTIRKLKNGRATDPDGIQPKLLKYAEEPTIVALHTFFGQVWKTRKVPAEWQEGIILSLSFVVGHPAVTTVQSLFYQFREKYLLMYVLLARLKPLLTTRRRLQQSGFIAGRSIQALRLLSEWHH